MAIQQVTNNKTRAQAQPALEGTRWRDALGLLPVPPLNSGDRLTRREFEQGYAAMPANLKCELIEGVVYMASPVRVDHARPHSFIMGWLYAYLAATPGLDVLDNVSVRLDADNEVQPDAILRRAEKAGGRSRIVEGYVEGAPELVVEIAASSASYDRYEKMKVYHRSGVMEYIVWQVYDAKLEWFVAIEGEYEWLAPDAEGILRSPNFPGLCLPVNDMVTGNHGRALAVLQQGLSTPDHEAFIKLLTPAS
jgi:Uma2 family endonuclease